jgi:hypothetical protein
MRKAYIFGLIDQKYAGLLLQRDGRFSAIRVRKLTGSLSGLRLARGTTIPRWVPRVAISAFTRVFDYKARIRT